jgi:CheY-like chemotaxis protein
MMPSCARRYAAPQEALRELEREAIIFEASDRSEATRIVKQHGHFDLILLDLELPNTDGFRFLRKLEALLFPDHLGTNSPFLRLDLTLSWYPTVSLVVVSERQDYDIWEYVEIENEPRLKEWMVKMREKEYESGPIATMRGVLARACREQAVGFIPKSASRETILHAFRTIFAGGYYIPEPPPPLDRSDSCDGPVNPRPPPQRTPGAAQAVDAADRAAGVVADSQGRVPWQS